MQRVRLAEHGAQALLDAYDRGARADREAAARQEAWLAAAPPPLIPLLPSLFVGDIPVFGPERYAPAARALAAALGPRQTAAALLAWYGSGAGLYSGHPAYEDVASSLLDAAGSDVVLGVIATGDLPDVAEAGAARFLATHGATRAQKEAISRIVPPPRREALRERVRAAGVADNLARFDRALAPLAEAVPEGMELAATGRHGHLRHVRAAGDTLVAVDGSTLVRFDPGSPDPVVLLALPEGTIPSLALGDGVVITEQHGSVVRLPLGGGAPVTIAKGPGRATDWCVHDGRLCVAQEGAVRRVPLVGGEWETLVPARPGGMWGLTTTARGLCYLRGQAKRSWLFGAKEVVTVERLDAARRVVDVLAEAPAPDGFLGFRLTAGASGALFWSSGPGRLSVLPASGGSPRKIDVEGSTLALASAPVGAYALLARGGGAHAIARVTEAGAVETLVVWGGGPPVLGLASSGSAAFVVLGDRAARLVAQ